MSMKPCTNPQICGVQNHREGTVCHASSGGVSGQSGTSQNFGAVSKGASASQKHLPEGFTAESVVQLDSGSVTIGHFGDSGQVAVFQAKGNDDPYATICIGRLGDLSDHDEDATGYPSSTPVVAMGVEVGESSDDFPPRELSMHNGQVIMDNGLWAVPGTPYAGHSTLDQFAETSGAHENGSYDWESADDRAYSEGDMEREWGTKKRFDTAYVMRDFAQTDEGKAYFNSMNLPQLDESRVHKGSPYGESSEFSRNQGAAASRLTMESELGAHYDSSTIQRDESGNYTARANSDHEFASGGDRWSIKAGDHVMRNSQGYVTAVYEGGLNPEAWGSVTHDRKRPVLKGNTKIM